MVLSPLRRLTSHGQRFPTKVLPLLCLICFALFVIIWQCWRVFPRPAVLLQDQEVVPRNLELLASSEISPNNTFLPLVIGESSDYLLDLQALLPFVTRKRFHDRARRFSEGTAGLLKDELYRAQAYGFCRQPLNWLSRFELGYQLESAIPASYFAHLHGCLNSTQAYRGSYPFYFFSPAHHIHNHSIQFPSHNLDIYVPEDPYLNTWVDLAEAEKAKAMNIYRTRHPARYGVVWPPFKDFYSSSFLVPLSPASKPIAVVAGKHSQEWSSPPINTFAQPSELAPIMESLSNHSYLTIYNRAIKKFAGDAPWDVEDPEDHQYLRDTFRGKVLIAQDLMELVKPITDYPDEEEDELWNVLQLMLYTYSRTFIATQGGNGFIASMFDGVEFILHKAGTEALALHDPPIPDDYVYQWWGSHSGTQVFAFAFHDDLYRNLEAYLSQQAVATNVL